MILAWIKSLFFPKNTDEKHRLRRKKTTLNATDFARIRHLHRQGYSQNRIAKMFNIAQSRVSVIINNKG